MTTAIDYGTIVSTLAFALRHNPTCFGLELDDEGWASLHDVLLAIRFDRYDWALVDGEMLKSVVKGADRFEICGGRIRATYGHSVELVKLPPITVPPMVLFHGTTKETLPAVRQEGLKPIGRRFVHLTSNREYALRVAHAKQSHAVVLVHAADAHASGRIFRRANDHVWLTDHVAACFLELEG